MQTYQVNHLDRKPGFMSVRDILWLLRPFANVCETVVRGTVLLIRLILIILRNPSYSNYNLGIMEHCLNIATSGVTISTLQGGPAASQDL